MEKGDLGMDYAAAHNVKMSNGGLHCHKSQPNQSIFYNSNNNNQMSFWHIHNA